MGFVEPGTGWPGDRATPDTPVARSAGGVRRLAAGSRDLLTLDARSSVCRACPRLVEWRAVWPIGIAAANTRTLSANARVTMKMTEVNLRAPRPKRRSSS